MAPPFISDFKTIMGSDVSADLFPPQLPTSLSTHTRISPPWPDLRDTVPIDLVQVNTTPMEGPARQLLYPDDRWVELETGKPPHFPAEPTLSPQMEHMDRRCARSRVPPHAEILPVIKHRMISSMPETATDCPKYDWMYGTLGEALVFLSMTGSRKTPKRALSALAILHEVHPIHSRAVDLRRRYVWAIRWSSSITPPRLCLSES